MGFYEKKNIIIIINEMEDIMKVGIAMIFSLMELIKTHFIQYIPGNVTN